MDELVYFIASKGIYIVLALLVIKTFLIINYRGFVFYYLLTNFFIIYTHAKMEADPRRKRFRLLHNTFTVIFYLFLLLWLAIQLAVPHN